MSKAKHTSAPWSASKQICESPNGVIYKKINHLVNGSGVEGLAVVHEGCLGEDSIAEMEANARLIAEAPAMLEMLQRIVDLEPILAYPNDTHAEHQGEAQAVSTMLNDVKELIKKIEQ